MTASQKVPKCRVCDGEYLKRNMRQIVCSPMCAAKWPQLKRQRDAERAERKAIREARQRLKTKSEWMKEAQAAFNAFIRARDYGKPCISSGRAMDDSGLLTGSKMDAGHYRSAGAASHLRFNTWNCHGQSVKDNQHLSGNAVEYRIRLIERIGLERVEALENDNEPRTFDIEYLKRIKRIFSRRARHYRKLRGMA